jgi:hypothetical protein
MGPHPEWERAHAREKAERERRAAIERLVAAAEDAPRDRIEAAVELLTPEGIDARED